MRADGRPKPEMAIAWDELDIVAPDGVGMAVALRRMGGEDPWKEFFQARQRLR